MTETTSSLGIVKPLHISVMCGSSVRFESRARDIEHSFSLWTGKTVSAWKLGRAEHGREHRPSPRRPESFDGLGGKVRRGRKHARQTKA